MNRNPDSLRPRPLIPRNLSIPVPTLWCLATAFLAPVASADLFVDLTPSALGGGRYGYAISVENTGPKEVAIVSLVDAPGNDPLIGATLFAPSGFSTSYDPSLGIIDLLPDLSFSIGTATGGFGFETSTAPGSLLNLFEALTIDGDLITGRIRYRPPGVPDDGPWLPALLLGTVALGFARNRSVPA